jgi:FkbM family methyltransferase
MSAKLVNCARFVRALGPMAGLSAFLKLHGSNHGNAVVPSPVGEGMINIRRGGADVGVFDQIFVMRDYDIRRFKQWKTVIEKYNAMLGSGPKPLIVDCGANIGLSALYLAHLFPGVSMVAVEPEPNNFLMLQDNTRANPNIRPVQAAISDHPGNVTIANPKASNWAFQVKEASASDSVVIPAITIDQARAMAGDHQLFAVKIDIESAEDQLFKSNTAWLNDTPLLMIELHDWMLPWVGSSRTFFKALEGMDFDFLLAGEMALVFNWRWFR